MKRLLLLLLLLPFIGVAQTTTVVTKDLDTIYQTKGEILKPIKVGTLVYKDSTIKYDTVIQVLKKYVPPTSTNRPPIARAGSDITITLPGTVRLDGSLSSDPDNNIKSYGWRKVSGPSATITDSNKAIAILTNLQKGTYVYELRVADLQNLFSADLVTVTVNDIPPPVNQIPIARIQASATSITLPVNTVNLSAAASTDPDGTIASWLWQKIAGPAVGSIGNSNAEATAVSGLTTAGTYTYQLTVTDNQGAKGTATVSITVNPGVVDPPVGQPISFSFTQLPIGDPDINRPSAGAEQWHDRQDVNIGYSAADVYWRFAATRIATNTKGVYNWNHFDNLFTQAKAKNQKVSFGIMTLYPEGRTDVGLLAFDGGFACYPQWLHAEMQAESVKDWRTGETWTPNYNSPKYIAWLNDLNKAVNDHIYEKGYQNMINAIDIRGYGAWGEWHSGYTPNNVISDYPSGTFPTVASLKAIVDSHINGFPNFQLVCMIAAFDANHLGNTRNPPEIAHYILTHPGNNRGKIGWRRDQWGALDNYLKDYLENNTRSFNGVVFNTLIMDRWKTAPITGEPPAWVPDTYSDLVRQIKLYHATSFGNGNYGQQPPINSTIQSRVKEASKAAGYRIISTGGTFTPGPNSISITNNWQNIGQCPTYEDWNITYELVNSSGTVTTLGVSSFKLRLFPPSNNASAHTETFPMNVPAGSYTLRMVIKDPGGYRAPLPLQIAGRNADGSYVLKTFNK